MNEQNLKCKRALPELRSITLHNSEAFIGMRRAGRLAAACLDAITLHIRSGVTTNTLDQLCAEFIANHGGQSAPLGYKGFPKSICASVNRVVCHGVPNDKPLADGDIVNIDVTPIIDGWYGDSSRMYYVGKVSTKAVFLVEVTYAALMAGIAVVRPGATTGDIGNAIQNYVEANKLSVVRDFCGHGIGRVFHEPPNIMHFGTHGTGLTLHEGMIFTIEPMVNAGRPETKILEDGWTAVTKDRSLSAQFEHTIGVTADGYEIFTLSPREWHKPPYYAA